MARRTLNWTAVDGRDKGKRFLLTEMSARDAENWALRALLALGKNGIEIPDTAFDAGMAGIARVGLGLFLKADPVTAANLLDELMACVQIQPDQRNPNVSRPLVDDDTEEVQTRMKLKIEVFKLHTDFSMAVAPSTSGQAPA